MKRKSLLFMMASVCLFSCQQQDELQDASQDSIQFITTVDNESMADAVTRSGEDLSLPVKNSFSTGDVISISVSEQEYQPFTLGTDRQTWSETAADEETVTFCAHYPELSDDATTRSSYNRYRNVKGGSEYLFGTGQARKGSKHVPLTFKRMTAPVILLDEDGKPYKGKAIVRLFLKNKGVQDLFSGKIEADKNATREYIDIRQVSEGILTHLIPQSIKAGEKVGTVILDGKEETIIAEEDVTIDAATPVTLSLYSRRGFIDERTPLFKVR